MKKIILSIVLMVLLVSVVAEAQSLKGQVVISSDYSFYDQWYHTAGEAVPLLNESKTAYRNQFLFIYVFFGGYQLDSANQADMIYNLKIYAPDSSLFKRFDNIAGYRGGIVNSDNLILSLGNIKIMMRTNDPLGVYRIVTEMVDVMAGDTIKLENSVEITELILENKIVNDTVMGQWMMGYYQTPTPEFAIDAFLFFTQSQVREEAAEQTFSFFREIFDNNQFLLPYLYSKYDLQSSPTKDDMITLLSFLKSDVSHFLTRLSEDEMSLYNKAKENAALFEFEEITHPVQLDILWTRFYASGRYQPILKLIKSLNLVKYKGSLTKYKEAGNDPKLEKEAFLDATYQSLIWSLESNIKSHKLIKDYLLYIYKNEPLDETVKKELQLILTD